jgi:DNA processing protein
MEELINKIALSLIPKVGPVTARNLVSYCGGVEAVFKARKKELLKIPGVGAAIAQSIGDRAVFLQAEEELRFIEKHNIRPLFYLDEDFPQRLKHLPDSPVILFYKGTGRLDFDRSVAIVGTRRPTIQGVALCEELVEDLQTYNVAIISGLAFGIDVAAHRRCIETGIPTVGVLGHGLARIYPSQHRTVAEKMIENGGLLTEYTSDTDPDRERFPMRNRIIAGLCDALVVVETGPTGGSMISAQMANDYNRDVFAFPGRPKDKQAQGCNYLIKSHRAALIENARDLAYVMCWDRPLPAASVQQSLFVDLTEEEKKIVNLLNNSEGISFDQLTLDSRMTNSEMASLLLQLEFKGVVKSLPGKRYVLV